MQKTMLKSYVEKFRRERGSIHDLSPTVLLSNTLHAGLWELKNEYHASDPLHACVYILCLHSVVSHEHTFITIASHKRYSHLLHLKEQTELFFKVTYNKHELEK